MNTMVELMAAPVRGELVMALRGADGTGWELRFKVRGKGRSFRADERGLDAVRDVDFERPLPRREKSILTRENLRIADELAGVSRPLAGCSACLLVVLVVLVVVAVITFFV